MEFMGFLLHLLLVAMASVSAIRLPACRHDNTLEVSTTSNTTVITCDGFNASDVIVWRLETSSRNTTLGECDANGVCRTEPQTPAFVTFSRNSSDVITTMTLSDVMPPVEGGVIVTCSVKGAVETAARCTLDVVYPAEVASCSTQTAHASWTADVRCDVTKVKSSLNRYQCHWYRGTSENSQTEFLKVTTFSTRPHADPSFQQGTCTLTSDLVAKGGSYYYRAVVYPGGTEQVTKPVILVEPFHPTISCSPSPWTKESTQLTCSCVTRFPGQPVGRLQFFRGGVGVVTSGRYGDVTLDMTPQNVSLADLHTDRAYFSCFVDWVGNNQRDLHKVTLEEASSVPLVLALTVGILGALLFLALLAVLVACCFWRRRRRSRHQRQLPKSLEAFDRHPGFKPKF